MTGVPSPEPPPLTSKHLLPIPRISVAWPTFEKAANSTVTKIVAQTVFVTGASLTGISFCVPVSEKCTPNSLWLALLSGSRWKTLAAVLALELVAVDAQKVGGSADKPAMRAIPEHLRDVVAGLAQSDSPARFQCDTPNRCGSCTDLVGVEVFLVAAVFAANQT